jgi:hypothetical protein
VYTPNPSRFYLKFASAEAAKKALSALMETKMEFEGLIGAGPDPKGNPFFLELLMDYYNSMTISSIGRFLDVTFTVECNAGTIVYRYWPTVKEFIAIGVSAGGC